MISVTQPAQSIPSKTKARISERGTMLLLFGISFVYMLAFRRVVNMEPDEGIILQGAERILHGQVPYRDFFTFYTPGSFYVTAFLFKVFGDSILTARTALMFFGAAFPVITYALARRTCSKSISFFVAILVAVDAAPYRFLVLHNWDSTFWACLCAYCSIRWLESDARHWAFATGTLASFTVLTEQSKGAGLILGLGLAVSILALNKLCPVGISAAVAGLLWPVLCTCAFFDSRNAMRSMLLAWLWPLRHYTAANRVPYGYENWSDAARTAIFHSGPVVLRAIKALAVSPGFIIPSLPLIAVGLLIYWTVRLRELRNERSAHFVLLSAIISGLLVSVIVARADIIHFIYLAPLFFLVLAWILGTSDFALPLLYAWRPYLLLYVGISFGLMAMAMLSSALGARSTVETRRGTIRSRQPDFLLGYALAHPSPAGSVLVYPYLPLYYYLTATPSPSGYDYFQPGMNTTAQAEEILLSLRSKGVTTVMFEPDFSEKVPNSWPRTPWSAFAADPIADYIAHNYKVCRALQSAAGWKFLYMVARGESCP